MGPIPGNQSKDILLDSALILIMLLVKSDKS